MGKKKLSSRQAALLEFEKEPMDDYYENSLLGIPSRWRVKKILKEIKTFKNKKILDVGCEAGFVSIKLAEKGAQVVAIDFIDEPLNLFRKKIKKRGEITKRVRIIKADARNIPLKSKSFDTIVATEVIEHMPKLEKFVNESHRLLKNKGKLIITFPYEELREKIYPVVKILGINTDVEKEVTLFTYKLKDIIDIFQKKFKLEKKYCLPPLVPITRLLVFKKKK